MGASPRDGLRKGAILSNMDGLPTPRSRIFVSYRRGGDDDFVATRLVDDLRRVFTPEQVFHDVTSIAPGADFAEVLQTALDACAAALVVIGPTWAKAADGSGLSRLDDPEDWVRQEVSRCLAQPDVRVFPILVRNAEMPKPEELPEPLRPLRRRQALQLSNRYWQNNVAELVKYLTEVLADSERRAKEQADSERRAKEQADSERRAKEQADSERRAKEQADSERRAKEQADSERRAKELGPSGESEQAQQAEQAGSVPRKPALPILGLFFGACWNVPRATCNGADQFRALVRRTGRSRTTERARSVGRKRAGSDRH